jgi:four helix bundle protein
VERFGFRKLRVYQVAKEVVAEVNRLARSIPRDHLDLVWQMRRAARSIALNIAEGAGEFAPKEKARIYRIARRSAWETVAAFDLAIDDGFFSPNELETVFGKLDSVIGMLVNIGRANERKHSYRSKRPGSRG